MSVLRGNMGRLYRVIEGERRPILSIARDVAIRLNRRKLRLVKGEGTAPALPPAGVQGPSSPY